MRNRIGTRLIGGFIISAIITTVVGVVAIYSLNNTIAIANGTININILEESMTSFVQNLQQLNLR